MLNERQLYVLGHPYAPPVECRAYGLRVVKASAKAKFEAEALARAERMREFYGLTDFVPSRIPRYTVSPPVVSGNTLHTNGAMERFIRAMDSYEYQRPPVEPLRYGYRYPRPAPRDNGQTLQSRNETREAARSVNAAQTQAALNRLLGI